MTPSTPKKHFPRIRLISVYSAPNRSKAIMSKFIKTVQKYLVDYTLLGGDLNSPSTNWLNPAKSDPIGELSTLLGLTQLVSEPTRGPHILDVCLTNTPQLISNITIEPGISTSDHNSVLFKLNHTIMPIPKSKLIRILSPEILQRTAPLLSQFDLTNLFYIGEKFNYIVNQIHTVISLHFPLKKIHQGPRKINYPSEIKEKIKYKHQLFKLCKKVPLTHKAEYRDICYEVKKSISDHKNNLCNDVTSNPQKLFKFINSQTKKTEPIPTLVYNKNTFIGASSKAELFASIFAEYFNNVPNNVPNTVGPSSVHCLTDASFDVHTVSDQLASLPDSTSQTVEDVNYRVLKHWRAPLSPVLATLFRESLDSGHIPHQWRQSIIIPIFKKGIKSDPLNYRPISLTSSICRILERIISKQILNFLLKHGLISQHQFGFLPKRSTVTQLLKTFEDWSDPLENNLQIDCIYIDISRAFDSVPHTFLLSKLHHIGIRGKLLRWIDNFLSDRTFIVKIEDVNSSTKSIHSGVPQGSVLGPLLFTIFINDLPKIISPSVGIRLFADDIKIFLPIKNTSDYQLLQKSINDICTWGETWGLKVSTNKTKLFQITPKPRHPPPKFNYSIGHTIISPSDSIRDLGILIQNKLNFTGHINTIIKNAYFRAIQILNALYSTKILTWARAYKIYVRPILEYATVIWNPSTKILSNKIERVQKTFTRRALTKCKLPKCSYDQRLKLFKLESLASRRKLFDLCMMHKICHSHTHFNPKDIIPFNTRPSRRHSLQIRKKRKTPFTSNLFLHRCTNSWNSLPSDIVSISSPQLFKANVLSHLKTFDTI